jgi:hypothetical protein
MADQISIPSLVQSIKLADNTKNPRLALKLWLDDYDSDKGYPLSIRNISEFRLRESMFLNLPIGQFTYVDDGTAKSANTFYDGRLLYVGFEYASSDDNVNEKNISKGRYRIVGSKIQNRGQNSVIYVITFIYDALALVNSVPKFPESSDDCYCQSTEAMKMVCASCGLPFTTNVDTTDQMAWFNPSMNARRFIQFIVNHSFINETDFGMFWVNKSGDAFFYGIRADLQNGIPFYFDNNVNKNLRDKKKHLIFTDVFAKDTENLSDDELKSKYENRMYILFDEDQRNDDGWVSDFYGNSVQVGVYDPMGRTALYKSDDMTFDWAHMTHKITGKTIQPGTPSTDTTNRNRVREQMFAGYSSVDFTHAAWDFAPVQNSIMRSEFFDNRHTIKINTGKQLKNFGDQELRIGDVLDIDFSMYEKDLTIDNGDYIVHSIDWRFQHGSDLFLVIRVASDSLHPTENETPTQNQKK